MDGTSFQEGEKPRETFGWMTHLAPLEHILLGSSIEIPGKNPEEKIYVNSSTLASNENVRDNPDLLKPLGLIGKKLTPEQVRNGRKSKKELSGAFACFEFLDKTITDRYVISYQLASPDEGGRIPNNFVFLFRPKNGSYNSKDADHLKAFDQVEIFKSTQTYGEEKNPLFSINKDRETGTISLIFMPLASKERST